MRDSPLRIITRHVLISAAASLSRPSGVRYLPPGVQCCHSTASLWLVCSTGMNDLGEGEKSLCRICRVPRGPRPSRYIACQPTSSQRTLGAPATGWQALCLHTGAIDAAQRTRCRLDAGQVSAMGLHRAGTRSGVHAVRWLSVCVNQAPSTGSPNNS